MSSTFVSLSQSVVITTIDYLLADCPIHPHQLAFTQPELRQKLVASVFNQLAGRHIALNDPNELAQPQSLVRLTAQREDLEAIIQRTIDYVLQENRVWVEQYLAPSQDDALSD